MRMRLAGVMLAILIGTHPLHAQTRGAAGAVGTGSAATSGLGGASIGGATALGGGAAAGQGGAAGRGATLGQGQQFGAGAFQQPGGQLRASLGAGLGGINQQSGVGGGQQAQRRGANASRQGATQPRVRSVTRIAFVIPAVDRQAIVDPRFNAINRTTLPGGRGFAVRFERGVATLTGTVATRHEARLAGALLALEPGVRTITNQLVVTPATPE